MKKKVYVIFFSFCVLTAFLFCLFNFILFPKKYENFVTKYSLAYDIESALVYSVIKTESDFNSKAVSLSGAVGLMQIMPPTAKWIAEKLGRDYAELDMFDEETNIEFGCFYLSYLIVKFDDIDTAICAYNAGETVARNWLDENGKIDYEKISYAETKNYYKKVLRYYKVYKCKELCV